MPEQPGDDEQLAGPEQIAHAVSLLSRGGVVAFPTETVYGLGADAFNEQAVRRVFELKGRPAANPLILHVSGEQGAQQCVAHWPAEAQRLAKIFWPGPLTLVLPKSDRVPGVVTGGGNTVAIRCPDHHVALSLLEIFGRPLVGPSANPSGRVSPTRASHVREAFPSEQVYVLEGGPCRGGIESTVLALTESIPRVLRPGLISAEEIEIVLGSPVEQAAAGQVHTGSGAAASPGMMGLHYAPRSPAMLFQTDIWPEVLASVDGPVVALVVSALPAPQEHTLIEMPGDAHAYAARIYAALREADALKPALIAIEQPPASIATETPERDRALWAAILDRLQRATSG